MPASCFIWRPLVNLEIVLERWALHSADITSESVMSSLSIQLRWPKTSTWSGAKRWRYVGFEFGTSAGGIVETLSREIPYCLLTSPTGTLSGDTRRDAPTPSHRGAGKSENASFVSVQEMKFTQLRASCCPGQSYRSNKWRRKPCNTSREPIYFVGNLVLSTSWILTFRGSKWCRRIFNELVSGQALWRDAVLTWSLWVCPWLSVQSHCHGPSMTGRPTKAKVYPVSCEAWLYFGPGNQLVAEPTGPKLVIVGPLEISRDTPLHP